MDLRKEILKTFHNKINFLFIGGSYIKERNLDKDIDIFCCVNFFNKKQEQKFEETYFSFHKEKKAKPDIYFPGELMTLKQLKESLKLAKEATPTFMIKNKKVYDGIVWAGMISDRKEILAGEIEEDIFHFIFPLNFSFLIESLIICSPGLPQGQYFKKSFRFMNILLGILL